MTIARKRLRGDVVKVFLVENGEHTRILRVMEHVAAGKPLSKWQFSINSRGGVKLPKRERGHKFLVQTMVIHNQEF